jgi:hypothetical protein
MPWSRPIKGLGPLLTDLLTKEVRRPLCVLPAPDQKNTLLCVWSDRLRRQRDSGSCVRKEVGVLARFRPRLAQQMVFTEVHLQYSPKV